MDTFLKRVGLTPKVHRKEGIVFGLDVFVSELNIYYLCYRESISVKHVLSLSIKKFIVLRLVH